MMTMLQIYQKLTLKASYVLAKTTPEAMKIFKENELDIVIPKLRTKAEKLNFLRTYYSFLPQQGSAEWLRLRLGDDNTPPNVGGSEIGALLGTDIYKKDIIDFYRTKLGLTRFDGNLFTRWGIVFENVMTFLISKLFKTEVYEFGALHGIKHQGYVLQCYSPDGLFLTKMSDIEKLKDLITGYDVITAGGADAVCVDGIDTNISSEAANSKVVLVEIKSPFARIPTKNIPVQYRDQVQLGLNTVKFADFALFFDGAFRKCGIHQMDFTTSYDFTFQRTRRGLNDRPFAIGYIIFHEEGSTRHIIDKILELRKSLPKTKRALLREAHKLGWYAPYAIEALGKLGKFNINWAKDMELPEFPEFSFDRNTPITFDCELRSDLQEYHPCDINKSLTDAILDCLKKKQVIKAILPWKLFNFDIVAEKYDPSFLEKNQQKIIDVMMDIWRIKQMRLDPVQLDAFLTASLSKTS